MYRMYFFRANCRVQWCCKRVNLNLHNYSIDNYQTPWYILIQQNTHLCHIPIAKRIHRDEIEYQEQNIEGGFVNCPLSPNVLSALPAKSELQTSLVVRNSIGVGQAISLALISLLADFNAGLFY